MQNTARVLLAARDDAFAATCAEALEDETDLVVEHVTRADEVLARLGEGDVGCVLAGSQLHDADALTLLERVREQYPDLPFVAFTDGDESVVADAIAAGATDCVRCRGDEAQYELLVKRVVNAVDGHRTRERLTEQRRRFRRILEQSSDLVTVIDEDATIVYESSSVTEILGYDPEERVGTDALEPVHPDDRDAVRDTFASIVDPTGPATERVEFRYRAADGSWVWLESFASTQWDPSVQGYVVNSRDVTERQKRERQLAEEREKYSTLVQQSDAGVAIVRNGVFEFVNESLAAIADREPAAIEGRSMLDLIAPEDRDLVLERHRRRMDGEDPPDQYDIDILTPTGERRTVSLSVSRITYGGEPAALASVYDVTERKRREEELEQQRDRLSGFASVVSHDLRNPLNVARGRLELVPEGDDSEHVDIAIDALDRMERIIENTLTLAREGRDVTEARPVSPAPLVDECWAAVATADAELAVDPMDEFEADPDRLRRLFENLFRNAVEHAGSDVSVTVGPLDDGDGFYVADDGPGIPEERRDELFGVGRTTADDGTGLGLAIVSRIAEAHGWSITAAESDAGGARFEIRGVDRPLAADRPTSG